MFYVTEKCARDPDQVHSTEPLPLPNARTRNPVKALTCAWRAAGRGTNRDGRLTATPVAPSALPHQARPRLRTAREVQRRGVTPRGQAAVLTPSPAPTPPHWVTGCFVNKFSHLCNGDQNSVRGVNTSGPSTFLQEPENVSRCHPGL